MTGVLSEPRQTLTLLDYRRRVADLYREVRSNPPDEEAWLRWRRGRDELFATHPQSALDPADRERFRGLSYYSYAPAMRFVVPARALPPTPIEIDHSVVGATTTFRRAGVVTIPFVTGNEELSVYWLEGYGGGLFLPFRDGTNGAGTYGGGRYLLDTAKGADLGQEGDALVVDFNYAYHPSCVHSTRWSCPLAPPDNHLSTSVVAGERLPPECG